MSDQADATRSELRDLPGSRPVRSRAPRFQGSKWDVVTDQVMLEPDLEVARDLVVHPGAVGVITLDDDDRVTLIRQYRHPVAAELWEIPAGLLDEPGESPWSTARRELVEEVGLLAENWHTLVDVYPSPGMSSETIRVFLARGLSDVDPELRPEPSDEERQLVVIRVGLDDAVAAVLAGGVHNSLAAVGLLCAAAARAQSWHSLRSPDVPWPAPRWPLA
jgi:ADP-ribose pyrophosphatase